MKKIICTLLTASILISGCGSTYNLYPINSEGAAKVNENTQGRKGKVSLHGEDLEAVNIHLEVDSLDWEDPDPEGQTFTGTVENGDYFIFDYGIGLSYYFMPSNIYLSGTYSYSKNKIEQKEYGITSETESGWGLYLSIGTGMVGIGKLGIGTCRICLF